MEFLNRDLAASRAGQPQSDSTSLFPETRGALTLLRPAALASASPRPGDYVQLVMEQICAVTGWPVGHVAAFGQNGEDRPLLPTTLWHVNESLAVTDVRTQIAAALAGPLAPRLAGITSGREADPNAGVCTLDDCGESDCRFCCAIPLRIGGDATLLLLFFSPEPTGADPLAPRTASQLVSQLEKILQQKRLASPDTGFRDFSLRLFRSFPAMIWRSDRDARCDYFNDTWLEFTGRPMAEEIGDGWASGVHPADLEGCLNTYTEAFRARRSFRMEYRLRRHDGEYRWILDCGDPFTDLTGEFAGYIGCCYDVTGGSSPQPEQKLL